MGPSGKFSLNLPSNKTLEIHIVELEDGRTVARTADELKLTAPAVTEPPRG